MANRSERPRRRRGPSGARSTGQRRSASRRPSAVRIVAIAIVLLLGWLLLIRQRPPGEIPAEALAAADAAGCDALERPVAAEPSRDHLAPGDLFEYPDPPTAAGPHDPRPLPAEPRVHDAPVEETRALHNLEHAYVLIWYRPAGDGGIALETIGALGALAGDERRVIMAPHASLPVGRSLALLAWNTRWMCPNGVTTDQATTIARGFIDAFRGTTIAPEAPRGMLGPLLGE